MPGSREGECQPIPVSPRIVRQQAQQTIRNLVDAVVELVTNTDDSYQRLEQEGASPAGKISVSVRREKGGEWDHLEVADQAEGMSLDRLIAIVAYGEASSGFEAGRSVRGVFGRGLKEAAIALGEASIKSVKDDKESEVRIWWDEKEQKAMREVVKDSRAVEQPNGTVVKIFSRGSELKCPTFEKFSKQVEMHFALRDINQNKRREVFATVDNLGGGRGRGARQAKNTTRIRYQPPAAKDVSRSSVTVSGLGKITVEICEAEDRLDFSPYDPCCEAGLLLKTEGAILDVSLFGFDNYDAGSYFLGTVYCPGIARRIREGDFSLIDADRSGLQWKHPACVELYERVREVLRPHVERKQKELTSETKSDVPQELRKKLNKLCALLNRLARQELETAPEADGNEVEPSEITDLTIKPGVANAEPGRPRSFSVYLPRDVVKPATSIPVVELELQEVIGKVRLLNSRVNLGPHPKYPTLLVGRLQVIGELEGDKSYIVAGCCGLFSNSAEFRVGPAGRKGKRGHLTGHKGGMFKEFKFKEDESPEQRVFYYEGIVNVYLKFPPISRYLGLGGKGHEEAQGSLMLAELAAEAFCRELARRKMQRGERPAAPGGEVDMYNRIVNELMSKHLHTIHTALVV